MGVAAGGGKDAFRKSSGYLLSVNEHVLNLHLAQSTACCIYFFIKTLSCSLQQEQLDQTGPSQAMTHYSTISTGSPGLRPWPFSDDWPQTIESKGSEGHEVGLQSWGWRGRGKGGKPEPSARDGSRGSIALLSPSSLTACSPHTLPLPLPRRPSAYLPLRQVLVRPQQVGGQEGLGRPEAGEEAVGAEQRCGQEPALARNPSGAQEHGGRRRRRPPGHGAGHIHPGREGRGPGPAPSSAQPTGVRFRPCPSAGTCNLE